MKLRLLVLAFVPVVAFGACSAPRTERQPPQAAGPVSAPPTLTPARLPPAGSVTVSGNPRPAGRHPLFSALDAYDVWFTGLRRQQSASRANLAEVEPFRLPSGRAITKVSALATWTTKDVWTYAKGHAIPLLPLYELGYTSIGCEPCTSLPLDPSDPRSGRWQGQKLECGIHIQPVDK